MPDIPMSIMPILLFATDVIHEIATVLFVGGLYFMLFVQLPAIASVKSPRMRLQLRHASFKRLFRWSWLGLVLMWLTGAYHLYLTKPAKLEMYVWIMILLYAIFTLLLLVAQFGVFIDAIMALEDGNSERASWLYRRLRVLIWFAFLLAVALMLLDNTGPALVQFGGFNLESLLDGR
ncbi:MAG: hypothetical protein N838_15405 [Thiohalocapsa sp. PB-PSB1]|nr:MAG: hypothetical protein N838_15405 [Thiohalocapsa sp. PB-PSB1]